MNNQFTDNKILRRDLLVVLVIIVLPFIFYFYTIVPKNSQVWEIGVFNIDPNYIEYVDYYIWQLFVKLFTLGIISIWFVTCKDKWRYVLLFPILFEIYKLFSVVNFANQGLVVHFSFWNIMRDSLFWNSIIVFIPYISILIFMSIRLKYNNSLNRSINNKINEEINQQLESLSKFNSKDYKSIRKELIVLKKQKKIIDRKEYLIKLIALRDRLTV